MEEILPQVEENVQGKRVEKEDEMDESDDPDEGSSVLVDGLSISLNRPVD